MGGIVNSLFGGSSSKASSKSGNYNQKLVTDSLSPAMGSAATSSNALQSLLGLNGNGAQAGAQANFQNTPGYQFQLQQGRNALLGGAAARGGVNSGAAMKGLTKFGQGLADSTYQNYMQNLLGLGQLGNQSAGIVSDAGKYSTESKSGSESSGGLGKAIGFGLSLFSDKRLKKDIERVGSYNGMRVYEYRYKWEPNDAPKHEGLMAQEVELTNPEAVFEHNGWKVVDYGKLR